MLCPSVLSAVFLVCGHLALASPAPEPLNKPLTTGHGRFFDIQVCGLSAMRIERATKVVASRPIAEVEGIPSRVHCRASRGTYIRVGSVSSTVSHAISM